MHAAHVSPTAPTSRPHGGSAVEMRRLGVALLVLRLPGRMDRRHVEATFASCYRERKGANVVALASLTFRSMMSHEDLARICESQPRWRMRGRSFLHHCERIHLECVVNDRSLTPPCNRHRATQRHDRESASDRRRSVLPRPSHGCDVSSETGREAPGEVGPLRRRSAARASGPGPPCHGAGTRPGPRLNRSASVARRCPERDSNPHALSDSGF